ncbi:MAG: Rpn family recombination-promoting nuclease/putative transposase [Methyloprofundus sp.]|nr:Rpn family recombination-promoting nuclease/putative transposase [Methyloprofundus sp.]
MKFLDVKTDFAFKKVFASEDSQDILINFLNAVIVFDNNQKIHTLKIVDPYNIPMLKGMKDTYVDVKAILDNGSHVIIEMQVLNHEGLEKRILYNAAKKYSTQLKKGEDYVLLNPVIALTITDFELFPEQKDLISHYKLLEKRHLIEYSDDIELIFIELPKFNKSEEQLSTIQDRWLYFIKNAGSLEYVPKNMSKEIARAYQIANEANFSEEELELQHKKKDWIYIQKSAIELATKTGLEKGMEKGKLMGRAEGKELGRLEEKKQMVINMHQAQVDIDVICQVTGMSIEETKGILISH